MCLRVRGSSGARVGVGCLSETNAKAVHLTVVP